MEKNSSKQTEKQFAEIFGPLLSSVRKSRIAAHIGSGIIEYNAIKAIFASNLDSSAKIFALLLSIIVTIAVIYIIEGGISVLTPVMAKLLVMRNKRKFENRLYQGMLLVLGTISVCLWIASPLLGKYGGELTVERNTVPVKEQGTDVIEKNFESVYKQNRKEQRARVEMVAQLYRKQEQSINARYAASNQFIDAEINRLGRINPTKHTWVPGVIAKEKKSKIKLSQELAFELDTLSRGQTNLLLAIDQQYSKRKQEIDTEKKLEKDRTRKKDDKAIANQNSFISTWGGIFGSFGYFISVIAILSYFIEEVIKEGSGEFFGSYDSKSTTKSLNEYIQTIFSTIWSYLPAIPLPPPRPSPKPAVMNKSSNRKIIARTKIENEDETENADSTLKTEDETEITEEVKDEIETKFGLDGQDFTPLSEQLKTQIQKEVNALTDKQLKDLIYNAGKRRIVNRTAQTRSVNNHKLRCSLFRAHRKKWLVWPDKKSNKKIHIDF